MSDLRLLFALRWRMAVNGARFAKPLHRLVGTLLAVGGLLLFAAIFVLFSLLLIAARAAGEGVLHPLIARTILFLFLFLLAGAVPFVSSTLFAPGDLPLLLASPARPGALVVARLWDAALVSSAQFLVIGMPLLVASAAVLGLAWWGWLVFVVLLAAFLLLPALLTAAFLLLIARIVGLRRVRAAVAVASALLAVGMCLLMVSEFAGQVNGLGTGGLQALGQADGARLNLPRPPAWLPSTWAADALIALGSPRPAGAAGPLAALLGATLLCGTACVAVGRRVLLSETLLEGEGADGIGTRPGALDRLMEALPLAPAVRALIAKDVRYVLRDLVLLSQIGIPIILYLVPFVIAGQVGGRGGVGAPELWALSTSLVGVIAYMETSILGLSSVGLEGQAFWVVLHAPVSAGGLLRAKFAVAFGASVAVCLPLLLFSCLVFRVGAPWTLITVGVLIVSCAALCGLAVGIAGLFPRFVYDNPAHRASLAALIWGFVGATTYVVVATLVLGGGVLVASQFPERAAPVLTGAALLFCLLSAVAALAPLLLARGRLTGYAWEH